ncbi:MAG: HEAT repeat domain-containing protein [Candidatus Heimdallarchaeota archaeon]|nr:HEAT repeat domain-containing protein [Candidatus Heimdallarchaeota archaeon]MCK4769748.1 HEAT repeat domain-containing protein [Candidatus Heimdallarchaeota archaeon]
MSVDKYIKRFESGEDVHRILGELKSEAASEIEDAFSALIEIGEPVIEPLIDTLKDEDKDIRYMAAKALEVIGYQAVDPLIIELGNNRSRVRVCATETLGKIGCTKAIEPLIATLKDEKEDEIVREYAVYALERIGKPAVKALIKALKDLKDPSAIAPLSAALFYEEGEVRETAVKLVSNYSEIYMTYGGIKSILRNDHSKIPDASSYLVDINKLKDLRGPDKKRYTQKTLVDFIR